MDTIKIALLSIALLFLTGFNWTEIVSVSSTGEQGNGTEDFAAVSADGRYVAFQSSASNLVANDTNGIYDIFVHDTVNGTTTRVSVSSTGDQAVGGNSVEASLSTDGRYVAFHSSTSNLVADDTNGQSDVFVHDTVNGTTTRVSVNSAGDQAVGGKSLEASISGDGRYVTFESAAGNLVEGDTNGEYDIFVHDTVDRTTTRLSVNNNGAHEPAISVDGRYVAFRALGGQGAPDTNSKYDIFVHDTDLGTTIRASENSAGEEAVGSLAFGGTPGVEPSISGDGRYVAFASSATNLVADDTNGRYDIFVHDTADRTTTRLSVNSTGGQAVGGNSIEASISGDGRYVTFHSDASNLVADDTNGLSDVFVHDTVNGTTSRVSLNEEGVQSMGGASYRPIISVDGRYVAFHTGASNLVANDTNHQPDIVMRAHPAVSVTSIVPDTLTIGSTTAVTISGTNFLSGATPILDGAQVSNVVVMGETAITADVTIPAATPGGLKDVMVGLSGTGPGTIAGAIGTCTDCVGFIVVSCGCGGC